MAKYKIILKQIFLNLTSLFFAGALLLLPGSNFYSTLEINPGRAEVLSGEELIPLSLFPEKTGSEEAPLLTAAAALVIDPDSEVVLYEKSIRERLYPASTTKLMTALVALEAFEPEDLVEVGQINVPRQRLGLYSGEHLTVENLLYGLLVSSGNDAAEALALAYPGGREAFVERMNIKANELSLTGTHFANPTGIDGEGHYSTALDLARLAQYALEQPLISKIVSTKELSVFGDEGDEYKLRNINQLLWEVPGVVGVKTGFTEKAGETLIALTERDGKKVLTVVMGSADRFGESSQLIEWAFRNHSWVYPEI